MIMFKKTRKESSTQKQRDCSCSIFLNIVRFLLALILVIAPISFLEDFGEASVYDLFDEPLEHVLSLPVHPDVEIRSSSLLKSGFQPSDEQEETP